MASCFGSKSGVRKRDWRSAPPHTALQQQPLFFLRLRRAAARVTLFLLKSQLPNKTKEKSTPVHGSAPDIAGKGLANPLAELLSLSMMLRYSFEMKDEADLIDKAVSLALEAGPRTPDIMAQGREKVGTKGMMDIILRKLEELTN